MFDWTGFQLWEPCSPFGLPGSPTGLAKVVWLLYYCGYHAGAEYEQVDSRSVWKRAWTSSLVLFLLLLLDELPLSSSSLTDILYPIVPSPFISHWRIALEVVPSAIVLHS